MLKLDVSTAFPLAAGAAGDMACAVCGVACVACAQTARRRQCWEATSQLFVRHIIEAWCSVSVGLCGRDRLADFAAGILDNRWACTDQVAFDAGLQYLLPRRLYFCSWIQGSKGRPLPYRRSMLLVIRGWKAQVDIDSASDSGLD